jgi:hypothetical protein
MITPLTVPLNERVEFASQAYIDQMAFFLAGRTTVSTSLRYSVRLLDPPRHLPGASGFTISFGPQGTTVDAKPDPTADVYQEVDYGAALCLGSIIHQDNHESAARREQEYRRLFSIPPEPGQLPRDIQALLIALKDYMAVRTVNNPDIDHRIDQFGLRKHMENFDTTGYTVFEDAFSADYADQLRREAAINHRGREEGASFRATMLLKRGSIWEEAALHPWILTAADYLLGRGNLLYQSDTIVKTTGQETHPGLHSDYAASRIPEPFPDFCILTVAVWAIDDFMREHGPTVIRPGSYLERRQVPPGTTQDGTTTIEMKQGSIAMWNGASWHGSIPRTAPGKRTSLHNTYCRNFVRPLEGYQDIDTAVINRNPPVFSTLCGLDDAFGKSGNDGADFERLKYAAEAGFGHREPLPGWNTDPGGNRE